MKRIAFFILVGILCSLTSCSTRYALLNSPNKLNNLNVTANTNSSVVNNSVRNDLKAYAMSRTTDPQGTLRVSATFTKYRDVIIPFLNGATVTFLQCLGMPWTAGQVKLKACYFEITDINGRMVGRYGPYSVGRSYATYMWGAAGLSYNDAIRDISRGIVRRFQNDVQKDIARINKELEETYYAVHPRPVAAVETRPSSNAAVNDSENELLRTKLELAELKLQQQQNAAAQQPATPAPRQVAQRKSDVDLNIPVTSTRQENTFVLIIANEEYTFMDNVQFALNDGRAVKEYCVKTLGIPERQVWLYENASLGIISGGIDKMLQAMSIFDNPKVIVYYCGHGIPDEHTGDAYIVPVDGKGTNTATCYSLNSLYKTMSSAQAASVTYFFDACFTGANKEGSMLVAARGTPRAPKKETVEGNTVVFSASSGDETAMTFKEKQHGLFTYFFLKKLQETKGDVSYGELSEYIHNNVRREAFLTNEKPQSPVTATSPKAADTWTKMKLK